MIRVSYAIVLFVLLSACSPDPQDTLVEAKAVDCDAALKSCLVVVDDIEVRLSLGPGVRVLQPFPITAQVDSSGVTDKVVIDFQMSGMEMGFNRYRLLVDEGDWQGTATLPVCAASRMDWLAMLGFQNNG